MNGKCKENLFNQWEEYVKSGKDKSDAAVKMAFQENLDPFTKDYHSATLAVCCARSGHKPLDSGVRALEIYSFAHLVTAGAAHHRGKRVMLSWLSSVLAATS